VILRAFIIKKTEKTPTGEIDLALQRAKELKP
jgi:phage-related protein